MTSECGCCRSRTTPRRYPERCQPPPPPCSDCDFDCDLLPHPLHLGRGISCDEPSVSLNWWPFDLFRRSVAAAEPSHDVTAGGIWARTRPGVTWAFSLPPSVVQAAPPLLLIRLPSGRPFVTSRVGHVTSRGWPRGRHVRRRFGRGETGADRPGCPDPRSRSRL